MNVKTMRIAVDAAMTVLLLFLMAYMQTGQQAHEWLGTAELLLFIGHHILNRAWLKNVLRGRYTLYRVVQTALSAALLLTMLGSMVSGIIMSQYVFAALPRFGSLMTARLVHLACGYWGFVLMSVHLGFHWGMMARRLPTRAVRPAQLLAAVVALYGGYAFVKNDIVSYLFLRTQFAFFDASQSFTAFFAEYVSMLVLWAWIGYYASKLLRKGTRRKEGSK